MSSDKDNFASIVDEDNDGLRIDKWISEQLPELSRSYIQKIIDSGNVQVDGKEISKNSYKLTGGQHVTMIIPDCYVPDIKPVNIPLDIIYEDDDILIVNKPKNTVVHPAPGHYDDTLVNAVMYHCGDSLSGINGCMRPGIVHRIDKDTTGSLIICKNDFSHEAIAKQLSTHSIKREYQAILCGNLSEDVTVNKPIGRDKNDRKKMAISDSLHGKNAVTHIKVIKNYKNFTHVSCKLETGRTHQIRVHTNSIHHPVLGDEIYGSNLGLKSPMQTEGQCLHAYLIGFIHPRTGEYMEFTAPLPEYFTRLLSILQE